MADRIRLTETEVADAVLAFRAAQGRDPKTSATDPHERHIARRMWRLSDQAQQDRIGVRRSPSEDRARAVIDFIERNGRTPRMNRSGEDELGQWLITYARPRYREGRLPVGVADILRTNPLALEGRGTPDQDDRVKELRDFIEKHSRLPRQHVEEERVLGAWMYAQRPSMRKKGTAAYDRCVEVQSLIAPFRGKNVESKREQRIAAVRAFVAKNGHLPKAAVVAGIEDEFVGVTTHAEHRREQRYEAIRVRIESTGTLPPPSQTDPLWLTIYRARRGRDAFSKRVRDLVAGVPVEAAERAVRRSGDERHADLLAFVAERGVLPTPSTDGNLYRWMYYSAKREDALGEELRALIAATPKPKRGRPKKDAS